jgi:alkanesulfonate monooxygenase SsuD/methylene tetrahydromethanopterin reductase-like flavin-dependent oxidoreductase (luciferase family)
MDEQRAVFSQLRQAYEMKDHGRSSSRQGGIITEEFADSYGVVGTSQRCNDRITTLLDLGVTRFVLMANPFLPAHLDPNPEVRVSNDCMIKEVLPALKWLVSVHSFGALPTIELD